MALTCWSLGAEIANATPLPIDDESPDEARARISDWISSWPAEKPPGFCGTSNEWRAARTAFATFKRRPVIVAGHFVFEGAGATQSAWSRGRDRGCHHRGRRQLVPAEEVTLHCHSSDVRDFAERFARAVGFSPALVADVARAAWLHDVGKADPRFQRWLFGGSEMKESLHRELLAKSALPAGNARDRKLAQLRAGYPQGYRHELLSLAMVQNNVTALEGAGDKELVLHLVASHHGFCRPFGPLADHPDDIAVELNHNGTVLAASTRHRLARLDSGVSDRFWGLVD